MWLIVVFFLLVALAKSGKYGFGPFVACILVFPIGAMWVVLILIADHYNPEPIAGADEVSPKRKGRRRA